MRKEVKETAFFSQDKENIAASWKSRIELRMGIDTTSMIKRFLGVIGASYQCSAPPLGASGQFDQTRNV